MKNVPIGIRAKSVWLPDLKRERVRVFSGGNVTWCRLPVWVISVCQEIKKEAEMLGPRLSEYPTDSLLEELRRRCPKK